MGIGLLVAAALAAAAAVVVIRYLPARDLDAPETGEAEPSARPLVGDERESLDLQPQN